MNTKNTARTECAYLGTALKPCGCSTLAGRSYCAEHYSLVYQVGTGRRRRRDQRRADAVRMVEDLMNQAIAELEEEGFDLYAPQPLGES